ncbi:MAG: hypothetical protein JWR75_1411 [Devosia sp.]|nr:hypothetical protein [Devosia sp.]
MQKLCLAAVCLLFAGDVSAAQLPVRQVIDRAVTEYIQPAFTELDATASSLDTTLDALCSTPSEATLSTAREAFKAVVVAWSRVEFLRFGPLLDDSRSDRMLFWPDRKGIALKQVQQVLAEEDATATDEVTLRQKSVALQGLGPLEYVLFGTGAEALGNGAPFRCAFGDTIATLVATTAKELVTAWTTGDYAQTLLAPTAEATNFRNRREVLEALLGALSHGIEAMRDTRLLPVVGRDGAVPKPKSALFWRSEMTVPALHAGFLGLKELFDVSGIGLAVTADGAWIANSLDFEFGNAERAFTAITSPIEGALQAPDQMRALGYLVILTQSLQTLLGENLSAALNLSVGFSSLDGD